MTVGFVAIARPTFDVPFASELANAAFDSLVASGMDVVGRADLAMSDADVSAMSEAWTGRTIEALVVVQASFADSTLAAAAAHTTDAPIVLWGAPEPRTGNRLRRNSLCGINLAAFRLANDGRDYRYVYADPSDPGLAEMLDAALSNPLVRLGMSAPARVRSGPAGDIVARLSGSRIGVIGRHPDGFEPCGFDAARTVEATGVSIEQITLDELFDVAGSIPEHTLEPIVVDLEARMDLGEFDHASIEPSVRLHAGLEAICKEKGWDAVATRCWPECFTEFGGAACTAQGLLTSLGTPAQCEADAYGAITALMLQRAAGSVAFTADLVDLDPATSTAVVWHCGLAPFEMAAPDVRPSGTVHSNRKLPLVSEFALTPGVVTIARLSQSRGVIRLALGRAEMLDEPRPFSGTAGTLRFERPASDVLDTIMSEGLEHHYGIVYGDVVEELRSVAAELGLEVIGL
jgi:L-fucose isomerase-like protein